MPQAHIVCVQVPEMQRCDLVGPILQLKALGVSNLQVLLSQSSCIADLCMLCRVFIF